VRAGGPNDKDVIALIVSKGNLLTPANGTDSSDDMHGGRI